MKTSIFAAASLLLGSLSSLVACGGATTSSAGGGSSSAGSGSVVGSIGGTTLNVASTLALLDTTTVSTSPCAGTEGDGASCVQTISDQGVSVVFTDRADITCSLLQTLAASGAGTEFANLSALAVNVMNDHGAVLPGTYGIGASVSGGPTAQVELSATTSTCSTALGLTATSGSVTLTAFNGTRVAGSYEATFGTDGTVSGSFDMPICMITASTTAPADVCRP
jgi:hypothetical protein